MSESVGRRVFPWIGYGMALQFGISQLTICWWFQVQFGCALHEALVTAILLSIVSAPAGIFIRAKGLLLIVGVWLAFGVTELRWKSGIWFPEPEFTLKFTAPITIPSAPTAGKI